MARRCCWPSQHVDGLGHLHLNCLDHCVTLFEFADFLAADVLASTSMWEFRCYSVCADDRVIAKFNPDHLVVKEIPGHCQQCLPRKGKKAAGKAKDAWQRALDAIGENDSRSESTIHEDDGKKSSSDADSDHDDLGDSLASSACGDRSFSSMSDDLPGDAGDEPIPIEDGAAGLPAEAPEPPPLPPPLAAPAGAVAEGDMDGPPLEEEYIFDVPGGGQIRYYPNRNEMVCHCKNTAHGKRCRLSRSSAENRRSMQREAQGRPLGLFAAWLRCADDESMCNRDDHVRMWPMPSFDERVAGRQFIESCPDAFPLLRTERPPRAGEGPEPFDCP